MIPKWLVLRIKHMNRTEKTESVLFITWRAKIKMCTQTCIYIYIYIYIHTHTHTHTVYTQFFLVMRVVLQLSNGTNVNVH